LAQEARPRLNERGQRRWLDRLEREYDNMRAALAWCFGPGGDAILGLRLVAALCPFWTKSIRYDREVSRWAEEALRVPLDVAPPAARAYVLLTSFDFLPAATWETNCEEALRLFRSANDHEGAALALIKLGMILNNGKGDLARGTALLEEGIALARGMGRKWIAMLGLLCLAESANIQQDYDREETLLDECHMLAQEIEDVQGTLVALVSKANIALCQLDFKRTVALAEQALTLARTRNDWRGERVALVTIAVATRLLGDTQRAVEILDELLVLVRKREDMYGMAMVQQQLGRTLNELGDHSRAKALLISSLEMNARMRGANSWTAGDLDGLACVASATGDAAGSARLFGAAEAIRAAQRYALEPWARLEFAPHITTACEMLGSDAFKLAWSEGQHMTLEQAIAEARVVAG
jgi:tetratricopeptide (TPR) repeat protein